MVFLLLLLTSIAQAAAPPDSIHYTFETVLLPDKIQTPSRTVEREATWIWGSVYPLHAVRIESPAIIAEKHITIAAGAILALAHSDRLIACTFDRPIKFRLGRSKICLIDLDQDGNLDHWFRRGDDFAFNHDSDVSLTDILPINPVRLTRSSDLPLQPDVDFIARAADRQLRICFPRYALCTRDGVDLMMDGNEHQLEFLGGTFKYRYADKKVELNVLRPPRATPNPGFNYSIWNLR